MKQTLSIILICLSLITLLFSTTSCKKASTENLLARGKVEDAVENCEDLEDKARKECFLKVAQFHFQQEQFKKAAKLYAKAEAHDRVINSYLLAKSRADAEAYCKSLEGGGKKQTAVLLARSFYLGGDYDKAIHYFTMAGEMERVKNVRAKIPSFKMVEALEKRQASTQNAAAKRQIADIKETLKEYIYMDRYRKWTLDTGKETDKQAKAAYQKAWAGIDGNAAPSFTGKLRTLLEKEQWSAADLDNLSFDHAWLRDLMTVIKSLDRAAYTRRFFSKYSVVFLGNAKASTVKPQKDYNKDYNFEESYSKLLSHTSELFKTLKEYMAEKKIDKQLLADYKNDLEVDIEIINYIAGMLVNLQTRIVEIDRRGKRIRKFNDGEAIKIQTETILWDFVAIVNQVMHIMGKGDYQDANQLMLSGYNTARETIAGLEKKLDIQQK